MSYAKVLKFGGSSLATPERIKNSIEIVKQAHDSTQQMAVVVSAFGGVTDALILIARLASLGKNEYQKHFYELKSRHVAACKELILQKKAPYVLEELEKMFHELSSVIDGIFLVGECSEKTLDLVMSFGERFSAFIISEAAIPFIQDAVFLDARNIIKTDRHFGHAQVDFEKTNKNIQKWFQENPKMPVVTGFIASSNENETTTLGRGGSDYTASIIGAALGVYIIEIWTDVDGVMTADPRKEEYAFVIPEMSYREAMEMSHFGAKIIHPPTIAPAFEKKIPLLIKNSFHPSAEGTLISFTSSNNEALICGISSIDSLALLSLQGSGMVGVCGIAKRLFGALSEKEINVILISQGSSEHSICFAILPEFVENAKKAIQKEFALEMQAHLIDDVVIENDLSVIAVVGENMRKTTGISGKLFAALGNNGINVVAIAQGSSELNISFVVKKQDEVKAINVIHEAFFLSPKKTVHVFLAGTGLIGKALLQQIERFSEKIQNEQQLNIKIVGIANSLQMAFHPQGMNLKDWESSLKENHEHMNVRHFVDRMIGCNLPNSIFADCTSSEEITLQYGDILKANISIVTPNKKANSGSYDDYKKLRNTAQKKGVKFLYGANVGAGLPIISTIHEMLRSGDKIVKIEAILSGTLSFLFNSFTEGVVFSELLSKAQANGFTEPDPRDDLNGMDVARKLLILARESGYPLEMKDITVQKILPEKCFEAHSVPEFYENLKKFDEELNKKRIDAERDGKVLRYIATFEKNIGTVSLQAVRKEHPFYNLSGTDNIVAITSEFYKENPLVIKGQGAGAEVTSGKVFADIISLGQKI